MGGIIMVLERALGKPPVFPEPLLVPADGGFVLRINHIRKRARPQQQRCLLSVKTAVRTLIAGRTAVFLTAFYITQL